MSQDGERKKSAELNESQSHWKPALERNLADRVQVTCLLLCFADGLACPALCTLHRNCTMQRMGIASQPGPQPATMQSNGQHCLIEDVAIK